MLKSGRQATDVHRTAHPHGTSRARMLTLAAAVLTSGWAASSATADASIPAGIPLQHEAATPDCATTSALTARHSAAIGSVEDELARQLAWYLAMHDSASVFAPSRMGRPVVLIPEDDPVQRRGKTARVDEAVPPGCRVVQLTR